MLTAVSSGATIGADYVQNLNETGLRTKLTEYATAVVAMFRTQYPNNDVKSIYGGKKIIETHLETYAASLPFPMTIDVTSDEIGAQYQATLRIQVAGIDYTSNTVDLGNKRLTITFTPSDFRPELRLDGTLVAQGNTTTPGTTYTATIKIDHPYPASGGTYSDQTGTYDVKSGNYTFAIVSTFGYPGERLIAGHQAKIDESLNSGLTETSEQVMGEALNLVGLTWVQEEYAANDLIKLNKDMYTIHHHEIGMVVQTDSYFVDFRNGLVSNLSMAAVIDNWELKSLFESTNAVSSGLEHGVLEQIMNPANPAASTVNTLCNASQLGYKIFKATGSNFASISPQLQSYSSGMISYYQSRVNSGRELIIPQHGYLSLGGAWHGFGFIDYDDATRGSIGFMITGGFNGGYSSDFGTIPPAVVSDYWKTGFPDLSIQMSTMSFKSYEPVDMASGAYLFDHVDLSLGGAAPMGLALNRSYNSSNRLSNRNVGFGWTHSYDIFHKRTGQGRPGLGSRTPVDAAAVFTALFTANEVLYNRNDSLGWMTVALIQKWAVDQLIDNVVTVYFGQEATEFIKLADGTYASPPGQTAKLVDDGDGTLSLRERFGGRMDFDATGRIASSRDVDGNELIFAYSGGKLSTVTDEFNRTLTFSYTGEELTSVSDSEGRSVIYGYDGDGDLVTYTDPENKVWQYGYDELHQMTSLTNPLNITTAVNVYDSEGRVETQTVPRQGGGTTTYNFYFSGFRNAEEDPFGRQMIYHLDDKGRTVALENELGFKNLIFFDGQNHEIQTTDPRTNSTYVTYNGDHNVTKTTNALNRETLFRYDPLLRLEETEDPLNHITHFDYDSEHHLTLTTDAENIDTGFDYYPNGQIEFSRDGRDTTTTFSYDNFGLPESTQVALRPVIQFDYDPIGRAQELTDNETALTQFDYDKRSLPLKITDPLLKEIIFTYDDAGRLFTRKDRNNYTTSYSYTPSGKQDTVTYPDLSTVHFTYDLHDQLTDMTDSLGNTHFVRDELYRVTSVTDPNGFTVSYGYDEAGNVTKITYPGNKDVIYTYDELNRLETVTNWLSQVVTYYYDDAGRLDYFTQFNGITTDYDYDDANRLTFLQHKDITANRTIARYTYTLDGNGNRETAKVIAPVSLVINSSVNIPYTYNEKKNRLVNAGGYGLTYDDEGQMTSMGPIGLSYDYEHRLVSVWNSIYAYDGSGNRLRATHNGVQTRYIYDLSGNLLAEADVNNNIIAYYVHGLGLLATITSDGQTFCYHFDASGNTIAVTDLSKVVRNAYAYESFGLVVEDKTFDQPFTFSGEFGVMQEPSGLYYMRARYYDPETGRFISEDPIGFAGGDVNLFAYAGNNPVNRIDPFGLELRIYSSDAFGKKGINHAFAWSSETGLSAGMWGSSGSGGNGAGSRNSPYKVVTNLNGLSEADAIARIRTYPDWNKGIWFPIINDCHTQLEKAFNYAGVPYPGAPEGRVDDNIQSRVIQAIRKNV